MYEELRQLRTTEKEKVTSAHHVAKDLDRDAEDET